MCNVDLRMKIVFERIKAWFSVAKSTAESQINELEEQLSQLTSDGTMRSRLSTKLLIVPSLERCFLRCADGLDGIEQLRDIIVRD